jgi:transposase InsO family protein
VVYGKLVKWEIKHRESFSTVKSWRAKKLLGIAHSDLCSVIIPTYGGCMYFITFIDHFSRKTWVYFLRQKSEVVDAFKTVKALIEKQSGCQIKAHRTNRDQEYLVDTNFYEQHEIQHRLTTKYTLQHNEVVERKNKTIVDMVRCMLKAKQMSTKFWMEVVATTVYILNRRLTKSVQEKTFF